MSAVGDWTLFHDLTGAFAVRPTAKWLTFAGSDELVYAAYNDWFSYAEVLAVRRGRVVCEFRVNGVVPEHNTDRGQLDGRHEPFRTWEEVAAFVAGDELGFAETGSLWFYDRTA